MRLIVILLFLISTKLFSEDIEIPDDLYPIEGASEILYSYEFDDKPKFIQRLNEIEFLIAIEDGNDYIMYLYNSEKDTIVKKSEFEFNDDEWLFHYYSSNDKLYLYFRNLKDNSLMTKNFIGFSSKQDGFYIRQTVISLENMLPISSSIIYNTITEEDFDLEDYNNDLQYVDKTIDKKLFVQGLEEKDIEIEEYKNYFITYDILDSNHWNFFQLINEGDNDKLYIINHNFKNRDLKSESNLIMIKDFADEFIYEIRFHFTYYDKNSNLYFIMSWINDETEKKYISVNKIDSEGKYTSVSKEVPFEIDDEEYYFRSFEPYNITDNEINLFGESSYGLYEYPISGLYTLNFNLENLEFDLKSKLLTEDDGEDINNGEDYLIFNIINKIIRTDDGYVILAENNSLREEVTKIDKHKTTKYYQIFHDINLFKLDNNLNFLWNNYIDREIHYSGILFGNQTSSVVANPLQTSIKSSLDGSELSFIYSRSEPEEEIVRVKYNITDGKKIEEVPLFENDDEGTYFSGYQFPLGNNEYVTILLQDYFYLTRYKLLK